MKRNDNPYDKMLNTAGRAAEGASGLLLALLLAGCSQKNPAENPAYFLYGKQLRGAEEASETAAASEISRPPLAREA